MRIGKRDRRSNAAFTLIELMIVVAIIGILSVLAMYGVRKYISNTKTTEARNALGRMANAAVVAYENENMQSPILPQGSSATLSRALCKSASTFVPSSAASIAGRKYQSSTAEWSVDATGNSGFSCLQFTIDQPQYFMYTYSISGSGTNVGDSFVALANGDLNGDGNMSTFSLMGAINSSYVVNIAPNMLEINPEE
jgi:type IV pilus assembly protein PilA